MPTGTLIPTAPNFSIFRPNIYSLNGGILVADIIRLIIAFIFIYFVFLEVLEKINTYIDDIRKIYNPKMLITLIMVICYCYSFFLKVTQLQENESKYFIALMDSYIDTVSKSNYYHTCYYIESLILGAVLIKIFSFFKLLRKFKIFYISIENGFSIFGTYLIYLFCILVIFSVIANIIWGPYIAEFKYFSNSLVQILLFSLGKKIFKIRIF
jgi:hypothetical protein